MADDYRGFGGTIDRHCPPRLLIADMMNLLTGRKTDRVAILVQNNGLYRVEGNLYNINYLQRYYEIRPMEG